MIDEVMTAPAKSVQTQRIKEILGELTYGGLPKTRLIGPARVQLQAYIATPCSPLRMSRR